MQNVSAMVGTDFVSVQTVPTTVQGLKQALTNQPVIVGVDASDWSDYYDVSLQLPIFEMKLLNILSSVVHGSANYHQLIQLHCIVVLLACMQQSNPTCQITVTCIAAVASHFYCILVFIPLSHCQWRTDKHVAA